MEAFIKLISDSIMGFFGIWCAHFGWHIKIPGVQRDNIYIYYCQISRAHQITIKKQHQHMIDTHSNLLSVTIFDIFVLCCMDYDIPKQSNWENTRSRMLETSFSSLQFIDFGDYKIFI